MSRRRRDGSLEDAWRARSLQPLHPSHFVERSSVPSVATLRDGSVPNANPAISTMAPMRVADDAGIENFAPEMDMHRGADGDVVHNGRLQNETFGGLVRPRWSA